MFQKIEGEMKKCRKRPRLIFYVKNGKAHRYLKQKEHCAAPSEKRQSGTLEGMKTKKVTLELLQAP